MDPINPICFLTAVQEPYLHWVRSWAEFSGRGVLCAGEAHGHAGISQSCTNRHANKVKWVIIVTFTHTFQRLQWMQRSRTCEVLITKDAWKVFSTSFQDVCSCRKLLYCLVPFPTVCIYNVCPDCGDLKPNSCNRSSIWRLKGHRLNTLCVHQRLRDLMQCT